MGVENYIFWSEIGSAFGEPGDTPPPRIPRSTPPPPRFEPLALHENPYTISVQGHPLSTLLVLYITS